MEAILAAKLANPRQFLVLYLASQRARAKLPGMSEQKKIVVYSGAG
jgi:hypothetical protein